MIARAPELEELTMLLGDEQVAHALGVAPGGWRDLSQAEVTQLGLAAFSRRIAALQRLVRSSYPTLDRGELSTPKRVGAIYAERLGALVHEAMLVLALDGRNRLIGEIEVARGGLHGAALTAADVLRPLIRAGASGFILLHNHPSGSPQPSREDVEMTAALGMAAEIVGVELVDHIVVAGRGGGFSSMLELGLIEQHHGEQHEPRPAEPSVRAASDQDPTGDARKDPELRRRHRGDPTAERRV